VYEDVEEMLGVFVLVGGIVTMIVEVNVRPGLAVAVKVRASETILVFPELEGTPIKIPMRHAHIPVINSATSNAHNGTFRFTKDCSVFILILLLVFPHYNIQNDLGL